MRESCSRAAFFWSLVRESCVIILS